MYNKIRILVIWAIVLFLAGRVLWNLPRTGWSLQEDAPDTGNLVSQPQDGNNIQHVVIISIDTCRADYLGCYGYSRNTSPNIDALAAEAVLFNHAVAPIPLTLPSHSTMLTGTGPLYHKVRDNISYRLADSNITLAEILKQNGFATGAVIGSFVLDSQFGLAQGFDTYHDNFSSPKKESLFFAERDAKEVTYIARGWLESHHDQKSFLFVHYYDPHGPSFMHENFVFGAIPGVKFKKDLYGSEIAYTDHHIGKLIAKLKELGIYDKTLLIVVGDHGEGLNDHFEMDHGYFVYHEALHVPLVIKAPGATSGRKINSLVGLIDIVPTICGLLDIEAPSQVQGMDLSGHFFKSKTPNRERYVYFESLLPTKYGFGPFTGVVNNKWKYIHSSDPELYDLAKDPDETKNLVNDHTQQVSIMQTQLKNIFENNQFKSIVAENIEPDSEALKRLESLGYVSGRIADKNVQFNQSKFDRKEFIEFHDFDAKFQRLKLSGKLEKARKIGNKMLIKWPDKYQIHFSLGVLSNIQGDWPSAKKHFSRFLVSLESDSNDFAMQAKSSYEISKAYASLAREFRREGDTEQAITNYKKALSYDPHYVEVMNSLAVIYRDLGMHDEAAKYIKKILELEPTYLEPAKGVIN